MPDLADALPRYTKLLERMFDMSSAPAERDAARNAALKLEAKFPGLREAAAKAKVKSAATSAGQAVPGPWGAIFQHATAVFGQRAVEFLTHEFDWSFGTEPDVDEDDDEFADELTEDWDIEVDGDAAYFDGSMDIEMLRRASKSARLSQAVLKHLIDQIDDAEDEDDEDDE